MCGRCRCIGARTPAAWGHWSVCSTEPSFLLSSSLHLLISEHFDKQIVNSTMAFQFEIGRARTALSSMAAFTARMLTARVGEANKQTRTSCNLFPPKHHLRHASLCGSLSDRCDWYRPTAFHTFGHKEPACLMAGQ